MFALNRGVMLIFLILGMFYSDSQVSGECCGGDSYDIQKIMKRCHVNEPMALAMCPDCEPKTPYCGKGPCNIFGCNCQGGCRT